MAKPPASFNLFLTGQGDEAEARTHIWLYLPFIKKKNDFFINWKTSSCLNLARLCSVHFSPSIYKPPNKASYS